jgi:hypothetical protein
MPVAVPIVLGIASILSQYIGGQKSAAAQRDLIDKNRKNAQKKLKTPKIMEAGTDLYGKQWSGVNPEVTNTILQWLQHPGQTSTIQYERAQENANVMNRAAQQQLGGMFSGAGWQSNQGGQPGGLYGSLIASTLMGLARQRNEAQRNQSLLEEGLKRQDQSQGMSAAMGLMQQILGLQQAKASINAGSPIGAAGPSPYTGIGNALGVLSQYFGGGAGGATGAASSAQTGSNVAAMGKGIFG